MRNFFYKYFWSLIYFYHLGWAFLGALIYNFPSRKIYVVGVTGTKGKSSTIEIMAAILEAAGKKVAVSSSVRNGGSAGSPQNGSSMTMPGRFFLQKFLRRAVDDKCDYALIEVTSQGVSQNRHRFIKWDAAIFTNLTPEHIESHGGFEKYREAKLRFFRYVAEKFRNQELGIRNQDSGKLFFINQDDDNAKYFIAAVKLLGFNPNNIILYGKSDLPSSLAGEFNKYNIGAAVAFARSQNISEEIIVKAVANFSGVPGRMEFLQREPFAVVIDYAHTPDSLRKVYETLRNQELGIKNQGKLICVLGCAGGGRDKWKRPEMGKIAAKFCDEIILTNEDPYDENPEDIMEEIEKGITQQSVILRSDNDEESQNNNKNSSLALRMTKLLDRKEAIKKALSLAEAGDIVIITGKGSEKWMHLVHGQKIPWNEKEIVLDLLKGLN